MADKNDVVAQMKERERIQEENRKLRIEYKEMFNEIDKERDGEVYCSEVADYLKSTVEDLNISMKMKFKLNELGDKGEYVLTMDTFIEVIEEFKAEGWSKTIKKDLANGFEEPDLKGVFKLVDIDKSGNISRTELKMACKYLGKRYGLKDVKVWNKLMKEMDYDNDGKLSFSEFKDIIRRAEALTRGEDLPPPGQQQQTEVEAS